MDDEPDVRSFLRTTLTRAGYAVIEAHNGRQATQHVREHPDLDLVISDLVMPDQEGLETIRFLRQEYPSLKMMAISGAFGGDFLKAASFLGAQAVLRKPISRDELLESINRVLNSSRVTQNS
jgi:CheY-like chemotaxis protein